MPGSESSIMWLRTLFFIGVIVCGIVGVRSALFPPPVPPHVNDFDATEIEAKDFRKLVVDVDAAIEAGFNKEGLKPAPLANDLAVARRLHLALMGTIPSLQEIRQFDAHQGAHRLQW